MSPCWPNPGRDDQHRHPVDRLRHVRFVHPDSAAGRVTRFDRLRFRLSATQAGLVMLPAALMMLPPGRFPASRSPVRKQGPALALGGLISGIGLIGLGLDHGSALSIVLWNVLPSIGVGLAYAAMPNLIMEAVPLERTGGDDRLQHTIRSVGSSLGPRSPPRSWVPARSSPRPAFRPATGSGPRFGRSRSLDLRRVARPPDPALRPSPRDLTEKSARQRSPRTRPGGRRTMNPVDAGLPAGVTESVEVPRRADAVRNREKSDRRGRTGLLPSTASRPACRRSPRRPGWARAPSTGTSRPGRPRCRGPDPPDEPLRRGHPRRPGKRRSRRRLR